MQMEHDVDLRVFHFFPDVRANHFDFLFRVAQVPSEESEGEGLEAFHDLEVVPGANLFLRSMVSIG